MRARMHGRHGRVVQKGIGEAHMFLLTRASWAEPNGSVYCRAPTQMAFATNPLQDSSNAIRRENESGNVVSEWLRALNSNSGVSNQLGVDT